MPPPIQQSGSRAALVTWTVVASILFVIATVLAIFSSVAANKAKLEQQTLQQKYAQVASEVDLGGEAVSGLNAVKQGDPAAYPGTMTLLNVVLAQRDALARKLAGGGADDAVTKANTAIKSVKDYKTPDGKTIKVAGENLNAVANTLLYVVKDRDKQIEQLTAAQADMAQKLSSVDAAFKTQLTAAGGDVSRAQDATKAALTDVESYRGDKDKTIADIQKAADQQKGVSDETINQLAAQQQEALSKAKKQDDMIKALQGKLRDIRQPVDQIVRQVDAHVMRIAGEGIIYIDLGTGDQVSAGMSFEVYDRIQGIPKIGDPSNDENLPKGKASIEILKVSSGSSECRIVRQTPGETVVEGDVCVNLVYDKNIKYNVMVFGSFDLDRNGKATTEDADVIKRLTTRWGGKVVDKLNADTDFLVIGKMPEVPTPSLEELDRPEVQFEVERKKKELADYDDLLAQASALNIPVLNQNRFLYFTGYYEQSAR